MSFVTSTSIGGDVKGPNTAQDSALAAFDGTTGKLIKETNATIDSYGFVTLPNILIDDTLPSSTSLTIPSGKQMIVADAYHIQGSLTVSGTLRIV